MIYAWRLLITTSYVRGALVLLLHDMERGKFSQTKTAGMSSVDTHAMLWRSLRFQNVVVAQVCARKLSTGIYCQRLKTIIGWIFVLFPAEF